MASISLSVPILVISLWVFLVSPAQSQNCTSQKFTNNKLYANCSDLPVLSSYLHWTYNASNSSLSIAFVGKPTSSDGWVAWAINLIGTGMAGGQALVAVKQSDTYVVRTYNLSSYRSIMPANLSFEVWDKRAEYSDGTVKIFASLKVPENTEKLNHIWQVGPGLNKTTGFLEMHSTDAENLAAKGTLNLVAGTSSTNTTTNGTNGGNSTTNGNSGSGGISTFGNTNNLGLFLGLLLVLVNLLSF
ncbi:hypothetical protein FNV43_RR22997 [Rhamnella rubrinervis]|uniref:DOMON domain-containing protein n=1 Tax=Rhamnella rubrinervis TaxID=2594499 RepID=A0A8K0DRH5_9ROSA|nr:hypothetical protein FNV43_RR22997 [Rhamnella rubrinervis]